MKKMIVLAILAMAASCNDAMAYDIVRDGKARATIVVANEDPDPDAVAAASEIRAFVQKISGVELPLVMEGEPVVDKDGVRIYVGHTEAANKAGVEIPSGFDPTIRSDMYGEEGMNARCYGRWLMSSSPPQCLNRSSRSSADLHVAGRLV